MFGIVAQKRCGKCGEVKQLVEFHKHKEHRDGHSSICKECAIKKTLQWQKENKERVNKKNAAWSRRNPEKRRESGKLWRVENRGRMNELQSRWRALNPKKVYEKYRRWALDHQDIRRANEQARRARQSKSNGKITSIEWDGLLKEYGYKCLCCGRTDVKLTLDHVIPLVKGGLNVISNAQPLCGSCNSKKGTKAIDYRP
jgi:5-methylcytosine-specific restriction endonuclease McrA